MSANTREWPYNGSLASVPGFHILYQYGATSDNIRMYASQHKPLLTTFKSHSSHSSNNIGKTEKDIWTHIHYPVYQITHTCASLNQFITSNKLINRNQVVFWRWEDTWQMFMIHLQHKQARVILVPVYVQWSIPHIRCTGFPYCMLWICAIEHTSQQVG